MAQLEVVLRFRYDVPDDDETRQKQYGVTDLAAMAEIDQGNFEDDLGSLADTFMNGELPLLEVTVSPV